MTPASRVIFQSGNSNDAGTVSPPGPVPFSADCSAGDWRVFDVKYPSAFPAGTAASIRVLVSGRRVPVGRP